MMSAAAAVSDCTDYLLPSLSPLRSSDWPQSLKLSYIINPLLSPDHSNTYPNVILSTLKQAARSTQALLSARKPTWRQVTGEYHLK
jgi:hypothetical protein